MGKINTDNYPNRPFASYQDDDMFILQDNGGETYTTNVGDVKNLADSRIKLEGVQVNGSDLPISGKKVNVDISGKTDLKVIAFPFHDPEPGEPSMGFYKGAYVTYNGKLYEFTQEHQGAWNPSHVREVDVDGMYVRAGNGGYNSGDYATTEGHSTRAEGEASHAEGLETIANSDNQHVEGKYNIADADGKYAHIVGNGTADNARSNAMTLDWDGNLVVSGDIADGNGDVMVEGNPVQFDSPFEQDAKSVVVSVKPTQDLHGYDNPWPAGGGKNKCESFYSNASRSIYDVSLYCEADLQPNTTYTFSFKATNGNVYYSNENLFENSVYTIIGTDGRVSVTLTTQSELNVNQHEDKGWVILKNQNNQPADNVFMDVQIELGSTPTSYAPYSNICPISGIDEVEIEVSGKNLLNPNTLRQGDYDDTPSTTLVGQNFNDRLKIKAGDICSLLFTAPNDINYYQYIGIVDDTNTITEWIEAFWIPSTRNNRKVTFTSSRNGYLTVIYGKLNENKSVWLPLTVEEVKTLNPQIEFGELSSYEPYTGHTTTIPLPSTLYDADVDVTNGSGDENKGLVEFDGSDDEGWQIASDTTAWFYTNLNNVPFSSSVSAVMSNLFKSDSPWPWDNDDNAWIRYGQLHVRPNSVISPSGQTMEGLAEFKAWLANNPLQVCYELATPTTLSFDPTDVELLEGTNVVTTNAEKVAVKYGRSLWQDINDLKTDTEGKLNKSDVADVEGDTASKAYSVNDFMLRADGLYKVTQPIAQNASITASNTTKTTIGAVLTALLNA